MDDTTHIDTLRVQAPDEAAQPVQLRLSTQLAGADLRPPGLAPAQVLLVRELDDPEPGRLGVDSAGAMVDRTWEQAVREALADQLRQAVRPTNGRVPPDAEAVLFRDAAEAWACWTWQRARPRPLAGTAWWVRSLERSADVPSAPRDAMRVADVWRAHPRLVPPIIGALAAWGHAEEILPQLSEAGAEALLRAVCTAYDVPEPSVPRATEPSPDVDTVERLEESTPPEEASPEDAPAAEASRAATPSPSEGAPWTAPVERAGGPSLRTAVAQHSQAHQAFFGVALALQDDPGAVRSRSFRTAWRAWEEAAREDSADARTDTDAAARPSRTEVDPEPTGRTQREENLEEGGASADAGSLDDDGSPSDAGLRALEQDPMSHDEDGRSMAESYAATDLAGVLYLVNVLDALDLPAAAPPPVGEHVGAWAVLEALARALLGPDEEVLRPNDPFWRALAVLEGRRPEVPAGRALTDAVDSLRSFRLSPTWLEVSHIEAPVEGRWAIRDGRLLVWTDIGPVLDLAATEDPAAQAEAEWRRYPHTGVLRRPESPEVMPRAHEPSDCAPTLAQWAACVAPYLRRRLAAALGASDRNTDWVVDLFHVEGKLYTTETHIDLVLPLDAARLDVRAAGLDRSPGWWPAGGRVVRFHFRDTVPGS